MYTENKYPTFLGHKGNTKTPGGLLTYGERLVSELKPTSKADEIAAAKAQDIGKPETDDIGWDACHYAVFYRRPETLKFLLSKCNMLPTTEDNHGYTLLHRVAYSGNSECARIVCMCIKDANEDRKRPDVARLAVAHLLGYEEKNPETKQPTGKIIGPRDRRKGSERTVIERAMLNSHKDMVEYFETYTIDPEED